MDDAARCQNAIGYRFREEALVERALSHPSVAENPGQRVHRSNQRLEFLGDAVLELVVSEALYRKYPDLPEGQLTRLRAMFVQEGNLAAAAVRLGLGNMLRLSRGEERTGGRDKPSILADALEAVFGAVYLDGGLDKARGVILSAIDLDQPPESQKDAKSALQEYLQAQGLSSPVYTLLEESGPAHARCFTVHVLVEGKRLGTGEGRSKKLAEQAAAAEALRTITRE